MMAVRGGGGGGLEQHLQERDEPHKLIIKRQNPLAPRAAPDSLAKEDLNNVEPSRCCAIQAFLLGKTYASEQK